MPIERTDMIDKHTLQLMLQDLESDRVERTISTNNTDKFGQAICAFANDLPDSQQPGYLILGADDKGHIQPLDISDDLLKNLAAIRTDGNIQPQPSMIVEKVELDKGTVVVVEVQPAHFPPVKYKGRIWVRIGPRKGIANDADEKRLIEKRASQALTFDALPSLESSFDDLDITLFQRDYLPKAMPEEVIADDKRDVRLQLQSLGFYDMKFDCPTYAGLLLFGKNVERKLPGAYVQYVRFKGTSRAGDIIREYKFSGNLMKILYQLDTFVDTTIANRRPVPVSALREEIITDYPHWAIRELLMNAICHRDYESNGPIQFYQYDDRIEILNPGGLYGKANAKNFPFVNDYRNSVVAEAMKVLGFVNRFSRGVLRVEDDLKENGNGYPEFKLHLETAFLVVINLSQKALLIDDPINDPKNVLDDPINVPDDPINDPINVLDDPTDDPTDDPKLSARQQSILALIQNQPNLSRSKIAETLGVSKETVKRDMQKMNHLLKWVGTPQNGHWEVMI